MSDKSIIFTKFKEIEQLISDYTADCITDTADDHLVMELAEDAVEALRIMAMEGSEHCPCCGEKGERTEHPEETTTTTYSGINIEHNEEDKTSRATLYVVDDIAAVGDWIEENPTNDPMPDIVACLKNLIEKLELKYGVKDAT